MNSKICYIKVTIFNSCSSLWKSHPKNARKKMINPANPYLQDIGNKAKCPDCDAEVNVPYDAEKGEVLSCPCCGLELEVKKIAKGGGCIELQELTIEGEDWGE